MPDRPVKLNWNLFRIIRRRSPKVPVEQKMAVATEIASTPAPIPMESTMSVRRIPTKDEPLAYCSKCGKWTPMRWRPKGERGKRAEEWFECEYCGGRDLTLRYLSLGEAMHRQRVTP